MLCWLFLCYAGLDTAIQQSVVFPGRIALESGEVVRCLE